MLRRMFAGFALSAGLFPPVAAQEAQVWLQVQALPTLGRAQSTVERYAEQFDQVNGYYLGSGWYGIALGPLDPDEADALQDRLVAEGSIPSDSFIVDGSEFGQRFWPAAGVAPQSEAPTPAQVAAEPTDNLRLSIEPPDETPEEARASEALLTEAQREQLQVALQWARVYDGPIDGAYGRGTRTAMAAWQSANGFEATGILTARQRGALLDAYNAILADLGVENVSDAATGIAMAIPLGVVAFAGLEPPFARYDASQDGPAQVLLISQPGDQDRLYGLYEIMQTLEIVPPTGERQRGEAGFTIEGVGPGIVSHTEVGLEGGQIKGFTLVWPTGDEERRTRLLAHMQASFTRLPGVLDPGAGSPGDDQGVDLVSGLEVRQPRATASGFFVDGLGTVVTSAATVATCDEVTIDGVHRATVSVIEPALGLAILKPDEALAPRAVASFQTAVPRIATEVAVAGYPYGGALSQPALTFGTLSDIRGLNGEEEVKRLDLSAQAGDAGGPVFDQGGAVLGMLLPRAGTEGQVLPPEVSYALDAETILAALGEAGIDATTTATMGSVTPERLTRDAAGLTVLVSCW